MFSAPNEMFGYVKGMINVWQLPSLRWLSNIMSDISKQLFAITKLEKSLFIENARHFNEVYVPAGREMVYVLARMISLSPDETHP